LTPFVDGALKDFFAALQRANYGIRKLTPQTKWEQGDFRNNYFAGDRLERTVKRVEKV